MSTANGERATINKLFAAYNRLTELGWRSAFYAPRDGTPIELLEAGSTGIHTGHRDADGSFWIADADDSWPSMPVLFRPKGTQAKPQHEDTIMPQMRAKMHVTNINNHGATATPTQETITFTPVSSKPYGPEGESEDNTYARYTPSGSCTLAITNPNLIGKFKQGDTFYVDFTPAE